MKLSNLRWKNSLFSRLVVNFLIIMIPIYVLGIYIYNWGLYTIKSEISKSTIAQVSFYLEGLEKEIERIKILQYDCLNDEYLNKLAIRWEIMDDYDRAESMRKLLQRLTTIKNSSIYIRNVSVHILPINKTITANSGVDDIDMEKFINIRVPEGIKGAQIMSFNGGLYLSTVNKSIYLANEPLFLIEIELNQDAFKQALTQFNTYEGSGSFLVNIINDGIIVNQSDFENTIPFKSAVSEISRESNGMEFVKVGDRGYYLAHAKSVYLNMVLLKYIPEGYVFEPLKNFYVWVWVFSVVAFIIILLYLFSAYKLILKPLMELVKSFRKVESGDLQVSIDHDSKNEFGYLYKRFNEMVRNLNMLIDQVYKQKILMQRAELKQLQSQINPHFLYNSFFMLNTMAKIGDNDNLIIFTKQLGEYFRFVTRNSEDHIPLSEEIKHAKVYAGIQQMRFSKRVQIDFADIPGKFDNLLIPRLIIQPLIENSFEHGIERKKNGGIISVSYIDNDKELFIVVEDNGGDMTDEGLAELQKNLECDEKEIETTGIINIHRRIRLEFGEESGLQVYRSELGGLKVVIKIIIPGSGDHV